MPSVCLAVVAGGVVYEHYAERLFASARELFAPAADVRFALIPGEEGWPNGTMLRPHRLLATMPATDFVYLCDADMLVENPIGGEILPPDGRGIVATLHPGYLDQPPEALPFETRPESACYVPLERRERYFCGGFWGGSRREVTLTARAVAARIDADLAAGITPVWHDESALNAVLASWGGPHLALDPSYCHPDSDGFYVEHVWGGPLPRRIVALDKNAAERGGR